MNTPKSKGKYMNSQEYNLTTRPEHAGKLPIEVVRVRITDAGRLALAG
jgi:hypothetical protein